MPWQKGIELKGGLYAWDVYEYEAIPQRYGSSAAVPTPCREY